MKEINLTQGRFALVDDEDFELLNKWKWHYSSRYARRNMFLQKRPMHYEILEKRAGYVVDHINGNTLDNRRENLRYCLQSENIKNTKVRKDNTSGYKGVRFEHGKYRAVIHANNQKMHLGMFDTPEDAARAYDKAAKRHHGEYARTNF